MKLAILFQHLHQEKTDGLKLGGQLRKEDLCLDMPIQSSKSRKHMETNLLTLEILGEHLNGKEIGVTIQTNGQSR